MTGSMPPARPEAAIAPRTAIAPGPTPRWLSVLFATLSLALVPVASRLLGTPSLPHLAWHWRLAWTGFDIALAGLLAATGVALLRRSPMAQVLAAITAALLCCDAWTDVLTSGGQGLATAIGAIFEAAFVELPLAVIFGVIAVRSARARSLAAPGPTLPRWLPAACVGLGVALMPWSIWLFSTLPLTVWASHWHLVKAGLDLALALTLGTGAIALVRRWTTAPALVAIAAALLLRDVWFNVLTARPGHTGLAVWIAGVIEIPLAAICLWEAIRQAKHHGQPRTIQQRHTSVTAASHTSVTTASHTSVTAAGHTSRIRPSQAPPTI